MDYLYQVSSQLIGNASILPNRVGPLKINWDAHLNLILGLRGVGKTTLLLHQAKSRLEQGSHTLYISLDDFYFLDHGLFETIEAFYKKGGEYLFIDEAHYQNNWDRALKLVFDRYTNLKVSVTGSSAVKIQDSKADLSRRAHFHTMPGLSFREYLHLKEGTLISGPYTLENLLKNHREIAVELTKAPGLLGHFHTYLEEGYFPFCLRENTNINKQLKQLVESIVDIDMSVIKGFALNERRQILKFLLYLATKSPFQLNISKVSSSLKVDRNKVMHYLLALEEAGLLLFCNLPNSSKGTLTKPDKIFLASPNLYFALNPGGPNLGSVREAFVYNQLTLAESTVTLHPDSDFLVDQKYVFEVGGAAKNKKQITHLKNDYVLKDDIEVGYENVLPLWMMGLLY